MHSIRERTPVRVRAGKIWFTSFASPALQHPRLRDLVLPARREIANHLESDAQRCR